MQFARDNPDINVVGVGAGTASNGDSVDLGRDFVTRFGADTAGLTMIYDSSFRTWRTFGVTTQPWLVLIDGNGQQVFNRAGRSELTGVRQVLGLS